MVASAPCRRLGQCLGELAAGVRGVDLLVDHADVDGVVHATGHVLVIGGKIIVQRLALVVRRGRQLLLVQNPDGCLGAHHGDLGVRPGEHLGGAQRT